MASGIHLGGVPCVRPSKLTSAWVSFNEKKHSTQHLSKQYVGATIHGFTHAFVIAVLHLIFLQKFNALHYKKIFIQLKFQTVNIKQIV